MASEKHREDANVAFKSCVAHFRDGRDSWHPDGCRFNGHSRDTQGFDESPAAHAVAHFNLGIDGSRRAPRFHEVSNLRGLGGQCRALRVCVCYPSSRGDHDPPFVWYSGEANFDWKDVSPVVSGRITASPETIPPAGEKQPQMFRFAQHGNAFFVLLERVFRVDARTTADVTAAVFNSRQAFSPGTRRTLT